MNSAPNPLTVSIALHYYYSAFDYGKEQGNFHAPAVQAALTLLTQKELLTTGCNPSMPNYNGEAAHNAYKPGPALATYVKALQSTPFPVEQWIIPKGE